MTPDGSRAVSASDDNTLRVWALADGRCEQVLEGHTRGVEHIAVIPDGSRAVSVSMDRTLRIWTLADGHCERVLEGHPKRVRDISVTPDGTRALSASDDETLRLWDLSTGVCLARVTVDYAVTCCAIATDGSTIIAGDEFRRVHILRLRNLT